MLKTIQDGKVPLTIASHEEVAGTTASTAVNVAGEWRSRIAAGTMTWQRYGGVHPGRPGNEFVRCVDRIAQASLERPVAGERRPLKTLSIGCAA